ncbi:TOMM precursor leader peptide-binding protein [Pseudoalteromonas rubra]|uniref:THIF-type NAD/FAD binding fold domain-containing protein n=1 Tax=Pseudoalteromonas rubra TaxID=43658 RepID=A0A0F4QUQ4_9GAMM|nr:TOMM precursor leader peptide-binding protein [Pseudoalteromonas rubra]KJZ11436.1 hypothetical protein TW77_06055 [Pseudoalteromonas rubra]
MKLFIAGSFGRDVATRLSKFVDIKVFSITEATDKAVLSDILMDETFVGSVTHRPYTPELLNINTLAFERGFNWLPIENHGQRMTFGPLVKPHEGPCYACYQKRLWTHHKAPQREQVVSAYYQANAEYGVPGHLPSMTELAVQAMLAGLQCSTENAGEFKVFDVVSGSILESQVIGVHGCPICGEDTNEQGAGSRFTSHLVPALGEILE